MNPWLAFGAGVVVGVVVTIVAILLFLGKLSLSSPWFK